MAKKKRKKSKKSHGADKKKSATAVHKPKAIKAVHKPKIAEAKPKVTLTEKIDLERSRHSYRSFIQRRYGKYFKLAEKPARFLLKATLLLVALIFISLGTLYMVFGRDLPDVSRLKTMNFSETTRIYDRNGNILYSIFGEENRKYVPLNYIAPLAVDATLSIEDKNFYRHWGFDPVGMIRAEMKNMQDDSISQGASTITQQLAKNVFLSPERTYERKIKELLLALEIEWMYSKDEILEMYLNKIAYGSNAFGIEAAAGTYFGKTAHDLNLAESSVLASLPKAPSYFSPYGQNKKELLGYCRNGSDTPQTMEMAADEELLLADTQQTAEPAGTGQVEAGATKTGSPADKKNTEKAPIAGDAAAGPGSASQEIAYVAAAEKPPVCTSPEDPNYVWGRKDFVLERMVEDGYISGAQRDEAWKEGLALKFKDPVHKIEAPHFVFYVKDLLEQKYGKELVESGGLEVTTSLDPKLQSLAEESVADHAPDNAKYYRANNAALVAVDPRSGQVLAMVGSKNYWDSSIDGQVNVTTSPRQPGSSFKPLVYALAMMKAGLGSGTILSDYKTVFNDHDVPHDADNTYKGKMTIRTALDNSRNIPAIKAYYLAGEEEELLTFLDKLGLQSLRQFRDDFNKDAATRGWTFYYGWPMAIGSGEVKLIDLVGAYGALADQGKYVPVNPILEVRDRKGNILEKAQTVDGTQVIDPQVAYVLSNILSDVSAKPAGTWRSSMTIPGYTVASKTGTSNKKVGRTIYPNNNIMIGYTPDIVTAVWVGNTDGSNMIGNAWAFADAGPIWKQFLTGFLNGKPDTPFPQPPGLRWIGKEVYPGFADLKTNFDARFKRIDTQETSSVEIADTGWVTGNGVPAPDSGKKPLNGEAPAKPVIDVPPSGF